MNQVYKNRSETAQTRWELASLEAALYAAGYPLDLKELCSVLRTRSRRKTQRLARELMKEYATRNTALEILELKNDRYVLQLKPDFVQQVKKLVKRSLLGKGSLKTLAYIAYKQPVSQKKVTEIRGSHAYNHIREIKDRDLVISERKGRSTILRTTNHFADYFGFSHEHSALKRQLRNMFKDEVANEDR